MVTDLFSKWKTTSTASLDDDLRQRDSEIILKRMDSIMTFDEANVKKPKLDILSSRGIEDPVDRFEASGTGQKQKHAQPVEDSLPPSEENVLTGASDNPQSDPDPLRPKSDPKEAILLPPVDTDRKMSKSLLVVEDEPVTQRLLKHILEERGYSVVIAGDGIDALMELGKRKFDLIVSDLSMPNLDGFKLLDYINMKKICSPVIFLTGSDDVDDEVTVLALGARDYIRKPINKDLLLLRLGKVLNQ